ncbi:MAG: alkaline phosphatase family protein, partial [Candidatus Thermoplasmatota archaeon]|nr:alkaline phosphatase family protein [Candidatus Thermoplasmatota archaeon]
MRFRKISVMVLVLAMLMSAIFVGNSRVASAQEEEPDEDILFSLSCSGNVQDVGDSIGECFATYVIEVTNLNSSIPIGSPFEITLDVSSISDPDNWNVYFKDNIRRVTFYSTNSPGDIKMVSLIVRAENTVNEDDNVTVTVNGTAPSAYTQEIETFTYMNSYEPVLLCEKTVQQVVKDYYVNYTINVSNEGVLSDVIDLSSYSPANWTVRFYEEDGATRLTDTNDDPDGYEDTGLLFPGESVSIVARVYCPVGAEKYHIEPIDVFGISGENTGETMSVKVESVVSWLGFSISDDADVGPYKYYKGGCAGHNVNPGLMTSYVIEVFRVEEEQNDVLLSFSDAPTDWTVEFFYPHDGEVGSEIVVEAGDIPGIGEKMVVYMNVTVPEDATPAGYTIGVNCSAGTFWDNFTVTTNVVLNRKVIIIMYNGVNEESLDLTYSKDGDPLWEGLTDFASEGSRYTNTICIPMVGADPNYIGAITSARSGTTGIIQAFGDYSGMNESTGEPTFTAYTHNDIQVNNIFNTIKSVYPNLRTAQINAKMWLTTMMADEDMDVNISGIEHPYYIREETRYFFGPEGQSMFFPTRMARHQCSNQWIFDAAIDTILYEDPDVLFISNVETDNTGHRYGSECDPNSATINKYSDISITEDCMHGTDQNTSRLFQFLKTRTGINERNTYNESYIVVTADHGMRTYYSVEEADKSIDVKEWLANKGIQLGGDYDYCIHVGPMAFLYGFKNESVRNNAKDMLANEYIINGTNMIWQVLDQQEMESKRSNHAPSYDQPFSLYNERLATGNETPFELADLIVMAHARYQSPIYATTAYIGFDENTPIDISPRWYPEFHRNKSILAGVHGTYSEQKVPLILHGPGIKQNYTTNRQVEILDIIPTLCELNGWKNTTWPGKGYFEDHAAEGTPL